MNSQEIIKTEKEIRIKIKEYAVLPGDTIGSIARKFNITKKTITIENNIKKDFIKIGQELRILPISGILYKVRRGDNIWLISKRFSAKRTEILDFNNILSSLRIGQKLIIPNGKKSKNFSKYRARSIGSDYFPKNNTLSAASYVNWKGIVPYKKGIKISVPKRRNGRYKYTKTDYGYFTHPAPKTVRTQNIHHRNGVDMGAPSGTNVYAVADGLVTKSYYSGWGGGYGKHILIKHQNGIVTMYAHLSKNKVWKGEKVKKGEIIGKIGNTGRSTGPHLHFEVRGAYNPF